MISDLAFVNETPLNNTDEVAVNTDEVVVNTDEVVMNTDEVVMNTDEVAVNTDEVAVNTDEVAVNTDEVAVNTDEVVANTDEVVANTDEVVANTDEVVANTDEVVANTDEVAVNTDEVVANTDEVVANTDEVIMNTDEVVANTDEVAVNTDEVIMNTDEVVANTDEVVANTDEVAVNTDEVAVNTDEVAVNTDEVVMNNPIQVNSDIKNNNDEIIIDILDKNIIVRDNKEMLSNPDEKEEQDKIFMNNDESPKIDPVNDKVFIDIPLRNPSTSAQLVTVIQGSQTGDIVDGNLDKADKLLQMIKDSKLKITNQLYIVSTKYDIIYFRFNKISLSILILSVIITFIEAIRLTIVNYDTQYEGSSIKKFISQETVSLIINVLSLSLSTILTILSSIVKFKSYRENMDKLKNIHDTLFNYKNLYDKQRDLIKFHKINNILTDEVYEKLKDTIEEYNKEIKDISIFENIRNGDILKFNKIKVEHDIKMQKMASQREIELLRISLSNKKKKEELENGNLKTNCFF
ncbi:MAG: hypothetical protein EBU80_10180 [Chitinophagia bacterium]|nr:hypothetical protein [Chitinophagia bacterium]